MMNQRANPLMAMDEEPTDQAVPVNPLDTLGSFKPKAKGDFAPGGGDARRVAEEVAAKNNFPSREASQAPAPAAKIARGGPRKRTGRSKQLNVRVTKALYDEFKAFVINLDLVEGELMEKMLDAFKQVNGFKTPD